jgi:UPF0716 protein FxsA
MLFCQYLNQLAIFLCKSGYYQPMLRFLLLLVLFVPLLEVYLFIQVGRVIGALPTIALCIFTAVSGSWLFRLQGLQTFRRVQEKIRLGEPPAVDMVEAVILLLAGLLLLIPGFLTDIAGLLCLIPPVRASLARVVTRRLTVIRPGRSEQGVVIIEGEFEEEQDKRLR